MGLRDDKMAGRGGNDKCYEDSAGDNPDTTCETTGPAP